MPLNSDYVDMLGAINHPAAASAASPTTTPGTTPTTQQQTSSTGVVPDYGSNGNYGPTDTTPAIPSWALNDLSGHYAAIGQPVDQKNPWGLTYNSGMETRANDGGEYTNKVSDPFYTQKLMGGSGGIDMYQKYGLDGTKQGDPFQQDTGQHWGDFLKAGALIGGAAFGLPALFGEAGAGMGAATAAGSAGADLGADAFMAGGTGAGGSAMGSGLAATGGATGAAGGLSALTPMAAGGSPVASVMADGMGAAGTAAGGAAGASSAIGSGAGASSVFNPAVDSQMYNAAAGASPYTSTMGLPSASPTMSTGNSLMDLWNQGKSALGTNLLDGTGLKLTGAQGLSALYDMWAKNKQAGALSDRYNQLNDQINNYYAPGSPEAQLMKQTMDRQDAAAGRNSQYGQRATDLAAKIAGAKMQALTSLANPQNALLQQSLSAQTGGLNSLFGYMNQNNAQDNMMNNPILNKIFMNLPGFGGKPGGQ